MDSDVGKRTEETWEDCDVRVVERGPEDEKILRT